MMKKQFITSIIFVTMVCFFLPLDMGTALAGPTVYPGYDASAVTKAALKYRALINPAGLNGFEGILGPPSFSPNVQNDFYRGTACDGSTPYGSWNASNHVVFNYNSGTGKLTSQVDANPSYCMEYTIGDLGDLNYLQIDVANRATGTTVNFMNVKLNGNNLGDFNGAGYSTWHVKGLNFTSSFTVEGDLVLAWPTPPATSGQETNRLQLTVGSVTPPPTFYIKDKSNPENFGTPTWSMNHIAGLTSAGQYDAYYEYSTSDGSAISEGDCADYESKLNFIQKIPAGQTIRHATYTIHDDDMYEPDETVNVTVHRAWWDDGNDTPIEMDNSTAVGTIKMDQDAPPTIAIWNKKQFEDFPDELRFPVELSAPTAWDVYFTWKTTDGTAIGGDDYVSVASQTVMIKGEKCRVFGHAVVEMINDVCLEPDETLTVTLVSAYVDDPTKTPLTITDDTGDGIIQNDDAAPVANFVAMPTNTGIDKLCIQFKNLSTNADEFWWDFGDGTTSTEMHPYHCFYNPPQKYYTITLVAICEEHMDKMVKEDYIVVHTRAEVAFNAYPIAGVPGTEVQFTNLSGGGANKWTWDYGDGNIEVLQHSPMEMVNPVHQYDVQNIFTVGLTGEGNGGTDQLVVPELLIIDPEYQPLTLLSAGATVDGKGWDNAIDHDVLSGNAVVTAMVDDAWAVFSLADTMKINRIRVLTNDIFGTQFANNLAMDFELLVSLDGINFTSVLTGTLNKHNWNYLTFDAVEAFHIKLVPVNAYGEDSQYAVLCELQAFGTPVVVFGADAANEFGAIGSIPTEYGLLPNYPNPFNPETSISYQLPEAADIVLSVYNVQGQLIATLVNEHQEAGQYTATWRAGDIAGGMYIYKVFATNNKSETFTFSRKMTLLK